MKAISPDGYAIIGLAIRSYGARLIEPDSMKRNKDGNVEYQLQGDEEDDYSDTIEFGGSSQEYVRDRDGEILFADEADGIYAGSQILFVDDNDPRVVSDDEEER